MGIERNKRKPKRQRTTAQRMRGRNTPEFNLPDAPPSAVATQRDTATKTPTAAAKAAAKEPAAAEKPKKPAARKKAAPKKAASKKKE